MVAPRKNSAAAITLLCVSPLVAEYLLGDLPLTLLPAMIVLAPAYGGAALLIRETARRAGRGWPTMLVLSAAYTLIAEGLVTQSLFNHNYMKTQMHLLDHAYVPALGTHLRPGAILSLSQRTATVPLLLRRGESEA